MIKPRRFTIGAVASAGLLMAFVGKLAPVVGQQGPSSAPATQISADKTRRLEKVEKKIGMHAGDKKTTLEAICYKGHGPRRGFVIESEVVLRRVADSYGYAAPEVDFEANVVMLVRPRDPRCIDLDVDLVRCENGEPTAYVATEMMKGNDYQQDEAFVMVVLPKSVLLTFVFLM